LLGEDRKSTFGAFKTAFDPERTFGGPVHRTLFLPTVIELTVLGERASMSGLGCAGLNEPETARAYI
jgi:hypothetical protein